MIAGRPCLKLTLLDPDTTLGDVEAVLDLVREAASALHRATSPADAAVAR